MESDSQDLTGRRDLSAPGAFATRVRERLAGFGLDPATEADVILELTQHVEDRYRDLVARGVSEAEADARAWRELEGHERLARELVLARATHVTAPAERTMKIRA